MAIFYDMIKGAVPVDGNKIRYYYIDWTNTSANKAPQIYYSEDNNYNSKTELENATNLGNILCSQIETNYARNLYLDGYMQAKTDIRMTNGWFQNYSDDKNQGVRFTTNLLFFSGKNAPVSSHFQEQTSGDVEDLSRWVTWLKPHAIQTYHLYVQNIETDTIALSNSITGNGYIKLTNSGYIEAPYFNTTSDKRAKDNIKLADFSALDLINQLPVYNFTYKNNPTESTIGLIAQEVLKEQKDLSLVQNVTATGIDNDYMSLKENRLIYVLWKAIQEQQEEINNLKAQLEVAQNGRRN